MWRTRRHQLGMELEAVSHDVKFEAVDVSLKCRVLSDCLKIVFHCMTEY